MIQKNILSIIRQDKLLTMINLNNFKYLHCGFINKNHSNLGISQLRRFHSKDDRNGTENMR